MKTNSAPHSAISPAPVASTGVAHGTKQRVAHGHREREIADVAGADEDAVEHEDDPPSGCMSATATRTGRSSSRTAESRVKTSASSGIEREDERARARRPTISPTASMRRDDARVERGVAGAERPTDDRLPRDRDRVEAQREEEPELERDLVRGDLGVADPRGDRRGGGEGEQQRRRCGR